MDNYKNDMAIDDTALDIEWLEQAELATKWGIKCIDAKDELARAEENVKITRAELVQKANADPDKYLGDYVKPTVANVEAYYRTHKDHKDAKERWLTALKEVGVLEVVKNEISFTRKAALENMVQLHGQSYFAGPKMPRDLHTERKDRNKTRQEANKRVRLNK